jgi:hypothetical protein
MFDVAVIGAGMAGRDLRSTVAPRWLFCGGC